MGMNQIKDQVFRLLPLSKQRQLLYKRKHGRSLSRNPERFTEKIQHRIIHDRRDMIARGGDKLSMKEVATSATRLAEVPQTLWAGTILADAMDIDFGGEWVLKPVIGTGYAVFGSGTLRASGVDIAAANAAKEAMPALVRGEWAYSQARAGFLIERRIETLDGLSPNDYRFFAFDGVVRVVQIDTPRASEVERRFYLPDWTPLDVRQGGKRLAPVVRKPKMLDQMIAAASEIAAGYDFIRVDLYESQERVYFGEITPYPASGLVPYDDDAFDIRLGSYWTLPG